MNTRAPAILDHLASLADTTRSRLLLLLDRHELTVSRALRRHAAAAVDGQPSSEGAGRRRAGSSARAEGTSNVYTMARRPRRRRAAAVAARPRAGRRHGRRGAGSAAPAGVAQRAPRTKSQEFFSSSAGQWDRAPRRAVRRSVPSGGAGRRWRSADWIVGDLGCGTGQVSAALAPFVARVIAVDASAAMLQAARKRLHDARQRRSPARRARGAADRRRAARRRDADAGAAPRARAGAGARRGRARAQARRPRWSSSTCCRTIARATGSRWATSGSDSRPSRSRAHAGARRLRRRPHRAAAAGSARQGTRVVRRDSDERSIDNRREPKARGDSARESEPRARVQEKRASMATVTEKLHPFAAAQARPAASRTR